MAGGTLIKGALCANINGLLGAEIRKSTVKYCAMMKVKVKSYLPTKSYFMPNIVLTLGSPLSEGSDILINPLLLIEILSPSTEFFDRIIKFESHKKIPTFKEYLLISQDKRCVEQFTKMKTGNGNLVKCCQRVC